MYLSVNHDAKLRYYADIHKYSDKNRADSMVLSEVAVKSNTSKNTRVW